MALVVFAAYALVALAAGVVVIAAGSARVALRALTVCLVAGACAYAQGMAPAVAGVQLVALAGAAIAALRLVVVDEPTLPRPRRVLRIGLTLVPIVALVLVLVGTWARQYVWTGRELPPGSDFGTAAALGLAWSEAYAPTMAVALLALLLAAIAGVAGREHRL